MGTEEENLESFSPQEKQILFRKELLKNARLFKTLENPEFLPLPTLKRINIAIALLAIEELATIRRDHNPENEDSLEENYKVNKKMSVCYKKLVEFLVGDSLTQQEKAEAIVTTMIVEFKSLYFLSDLAAGHYSNNEYMHYVTDQAKNNLNYALNLSVFESMAFPDQSADLLRQQLMIRKAELSEAIETGEISLDSAISLATEQTLLKCLMSIAISANTEMLPILHPGYHIQSSSIIQQKSKDLVRNVRNIRKQKASDYDPKKVPKKRVSNASLDGTPRGPKEARKRKVWSIEETKALEDGIRQFGNDWVQIQRTYPDILAERNPVALKDRARSMRRIMERNGQPLGVWAGASKP